MSKGYGDYIDLMLTKKTADNTNLFNYLKITDEAFEKICQYAKLVCKEIGVNLECVGYLLTPIERFDAVATDVILIHDQLVYPAYAIPRGSSEAVRKAREEGKKVIGLWHSHGGLSPSHSGTDDSHIESLGLDLRKNKNYEVGVAKDLYDAGPFYAVYDKDSNILEIRTKNLFFKKLKFHLRDGITLKGFPQREDSIEKVIEEKRDCIGFSYSIVVNNRTYKDKFRLKEKSYYAEVNFEDPSDRENFIERKNIPLEFVKEKNGIELDERILRGHIQERVVYEGGHRKRRESKVKEEVKDKRKEAHEKLPAKKERQPKIHKGLGVRAFAKKAEWELLIDKEDASEEDQSYSAAFNNIYDKYKNLDSINGNLLSNVDFLENVFRELEDFKVHYGIYCSNNKVRPALRPKVQNLGRLVLKEVAKLEKAVKEDIDQKKRKGTDQDTEYEEGAEIITGIKNEIIELEKLEELKIRLDNLKSRGKNGEE